MLFEVGSRVAQEAVFKATEGSMSVEWILANPWFLKALFGTASVTSGTTYQHDFTVNNTFSSSSIEVNVGFEGERENVYRRFRGAVLNSVTLTGTVGDVIKVRGEILYSAEIAGSGQTAIVDSFAPFDFSQASLQLPTGSTLAEVQSFELTIANNALRIYGLGSSYTVAMTPQALDATGRLDITMKDKTMLNQLRSKHSGLVLTISNGLTSNSLRQISFTGSDVYFGEHSVDIEANALVVEDLPITIRSVVAQAKNATATIP